MSQSKAEAVALYRKALNINEGVTPHQLLVETFATHLRTAPNDKNFTVSPVQGSARMTLHCNDCSEDFQVDAFSIKAFTAHCASASHKSLAAANKIKPTASSSRPTALPHRSSQVTSSSSDPSNAAQQGRHLSHRSRLLDAQVPSKRPISETEDEAVPAKAAASTSKGKKARILTNVDSDSDVEFIGFKPAPSKPKKKPVSLNSSSSSAVPRPRPIKKEPSALQPGFRLGSSQSALKREPSDAARAATFGLKREASYPEVPPAFQRENMYSRAAMDLDEKPKFRPASPVRPGISQLDANVTNNIFGRANARIPSPLPPAPPSPGRGGSGWNNGLGSARPAVFADTKKEEDESSDIDPENVVPDLDDVIQNAMGRGKTHKDTEKWLSEAIRSVDFSGNVKIDDAREMLELDGPKKAHLPGMASDISLMPHQVLSVAFTTQQERSRFKGSIVADEMGLGKTITAIATMVHNPPTKEHRKKQRTVTLILAPLALLHQWEQEIIDKCDKGAFDICIYHGASKPKKIAQLQEYDVILTTHASLALEWQPDDGMAKAKAKRADKKKGIEWDSDTETNWKPTKKHGILFQMEYHRVIIDEAHGLRNKATRLSRAVTQLKANYRMCLTGTLIVNKLDDAYPIFRFLRIRPFADWTSFRNEIAQPSKRYPDRAAKKLLGALSPVMIRRRLDTQMDGRPLVELPEKHIETVYLDLSTEERKIYEAMQANAQVEMSKYIRAGTVMKSYHCVLLLLLRLRQVCSHPALATEDPLEAALDEPIEIKRAKEIDRVTSLLGQSACDKIRKALLTRALANDALTDEDQETALECPVCLEPQIEESAVTACGHVFCEPCIQNHLAQQVKDHIAGAGDDDDATDDKPQQTCPSCRADVEKGQLFSFLALKPSDEEMDKARGIFKKSIVGSDDDEDSDAPIAKSKSKSQKIIEISDSDDDTPLSKPKKKVIRGSDDESDEEVKPARKAWGKKNLRKRVAGSDDDMDDFIDDDDASEIDARSDAESIATASEAEEQDDCPRAGRSLRNGKKAKKVVIPQSNFLVSTKMKAMMDEIKRIAVESDNTEKTIVVSQWVTALKLCDRYLSENNIRFVHYTGEMSKIKREESVDAFMRNKKCMVMLLSQKAGGVGLNLVRGNHLLNLDLAWSPAVDNQVFARLHRIGQTREVYIKRFIIANSVENRLEEMQKRKGALADGAMGEGTDSTGRRNKKLTVADLAGLFGLDASGRRLPDEE